MAWIFLVQGCHYIKTNVEHGEFNETIKKLDGNEKVVELQKELKQSGLLFNFKYNEDNLCGDLFFGKELHGSRFIYQGQTISASLNQDVMEKLKPINEQLQKILEAEGFVLETTGIVLCQFD